LEFIILLQGAILVIFEVGAELLVEEVDVT
jgi:hypothetical protein